LNKTIIDEVVKQNFEFDVILINTAKKLKEIESFSLVKIFNFVSTCFILLKKLLGSRYYLCYFSLTLTGIGFYKDLLLALFVKLFRIKILYHIHGKGVSSNNNFLNNILYKICFKNSDIIIVSQTLSYDIEKYVNKENIHILPHGIKSRLKEADFMNIVNDRLNKSTVNLLFLSNMIKSKGVFDALDTAKILKVKGYNFKFFFVGEWYDIAHNDFFNKVNQYNLNNVVKYLGFKKGEEKYKILKESDILVYPTRKDIFGLVNLEAMQFGLPVVTTYEGAIPEIIDDGITGFLVPKKDPEMLAEKISILINNADLRARMGKAGRDNFLREYTMDRFEKQLINIFHEVSKRNVTY
jgi:glycosyltransferase involved in cell wall biosynthesis